MKLTHIRNLDRNRRGVSNTARGAITWTFTKGSTVMPREQLVQTRM